jgi:hypothetical protein
MNAVPAVKVSSSVGCTPLFCRRDTRAFFVGPSLALLPEEARRDYAQGTGTLGRVGLWMADEHIH